MACCCWFFFCSFISMSILVWMRSIQNVEMRRKTVFSHAKILNLIVLTFFFLFLIILAISSIFSMIIGRVSTYRMMNVFLFFFFFCLSFCEYKWNQNEILPLKSINQKTEQQIYSTRRRRKKEKKNINQVIVMLYTHQEIHENTFCHFFFLYS